MANPDRDPLYSDNANANRTTYTREGNGTGWFIGIIVVLALLAIGYLVFSSNSGPATVNQTTTTSPSVTAPADNPTTPAAPSTNTTTTPMAPSTETTTTPMTQAPATPAPSTETPTPAAPATEPAAPAAQPASPAEPATPAAPAQ